MPNCHESADDRQMKRSCFTDSITSGLFKGIGRMLEPFHSVDIFFFTYGKKFFHVCLILATSVPSLVVAPKSQSLTLEKSEAKTRTYRKVGKFSLIIRTLEFFFAIYIFQFNITMDQRL